MTDIPDEAATVASNDWGRVDASGTVYVRTTTGERAVGSWQADAPEEGLAFFVRRFDELVVQVDLLEQRVASGAAGVDDAATVLKRLRSDCEQANAVGDLDGLTQRLETVAAAIDERRQARRAARAAAVDAARDRKQAIVAEAEQIAAGREWRQGADRFRLLLDEWKGLARLDRATDDELWHRFSTARTHYTRRRKTHFAELGEQREAAKAAKEALIAEAEELATSTDWGPTSARFRDLMARWKAAGPAARDAEDGLWQRFRAAQDAFFQARSAALDERDSEQRQNLDAKRALLTEAEALLPVRNPKAARAALRDLLDRWEAAGQVPRDDRRAMETRLRAVEDAVAESERSQWRRTNPEGRARAESTVNSLTASIAALEKDLAKATAAGDAKAIAAAQEALDARRSWLVEAQRALDDFSGSP